MVFMVHKIAFLNFILVHGIYCYRSFSELNYNLADLAGTEAVFFYIQLCILPFATVPQTPVKAFKCSMGNQPAMVYMYVTV